VHLERKARLPSTQCLRSIGERSVAVSDVLKLSAIAGPCIPACGSQRSRSKRPSCQSLPSCFASPAACAIMLPRCSSFRTAMPTAVSTSGFSDAPPRSAFSPVSTPADLQLVCLGSPLTNAVNGKHRCSCFLPRRPRLACGARQRRGLQHSARAGLQSPSGADGESSAVYKYSTAEEITDACVSRQRGTACKQETVTQFPPVATWCVEALSLPSWNHASHCAAERKRLDEASDSSSGSGVSPPRTAPSLTSGALLGVLSLCHTQRRLAACSHAA